MTQEEKAKAYDEAIKRAKDALNDGTISNNTIAYLQDVFPELKESEDERMRKGLITFLEQVFYFGKDTNFDKWNKSDCSDWIDWLEKQGEQKPAWSEEDEKERNQIITWLEIFKKEFYKKEYRDVMTWLESLKDRFNCKVNCTTTKEWEPSDEQIKAISIARSFITDDFGEHPTLSESLMELEEQLKNLKKSSDNINVAKPNFKA